MIEFLIGLYIFCAVVVATFVLRPFIDAYLEKDE